MTVAPDTLFPPGTPVMVTQSVLARNRRNEPLTITVVGVVEEWEELPTGSWHAHGRNDRLWLKRLKLRKLDGEETLLILDDRTSIARLETAH